MSSRLISLGYPCRHCKCRMIPLTVDKVAASTQTEQLLTCTPSPPSTLSAGTPLQNNLRELYALLAFMADSSIEAVERRVRVRQGRCCCGWEWAGQGGATAAVVERAHHLSGSRALGQTYS